MRISFFASQLFKENSPENSSVFSQCLERYFFKTKDEIPRIFETRLKIAYQRAECEISQCGELANIEPTTFHSLVNNCGHVDSFLLAVVNVLIHLSWRRISIL